MSEPSFPPVERRANPTDQHWHLKKEIQLGHVVSTLIFALTGMFYVTKMDQRIAIIETQVIAQRDRDISQDKAQAEALAQIHNQMDKMDAKLDRLIERR